MKKAALAIVAGLAITAVGIASAGLPIRMLFLLWPGAVVTRRLFANVYYESHMVGFPSGPEILSIIVVNTLFYSAIVYGFTLWWRKRRDGAMPAGGGSR